MGISQVVRSLISETLVTVSWLWLSTKLRSSRLKPHNHLLLMILVLLPMIPILSALVLNCNKSSNFGLWPFRTPLCILAFLWYNWSSIGGALTRWGTRADRAIFGSPNNLQIALRHVEQKLLMWQVSSVQAWNTYTGKTVTRRPERVSFFSRFEIRKQTICPANKIASFLWNFLDFSQVPCHKFPKVFYAFNPGQGFVIHI